jgi:ABC-type nitrate/sulfonate/bicarbonate transport system substrate-binding protein
MSLFPLQLALDWTPNVNHIGIFWAQEHQLYAEAGIEFSYVNPANDQYELTPGKRLLLGQVELAMAPFETVISLNNKPHPFDAVAVYALLQEDVSCIVGLQSKGIHRPAQMDGRTYASYKARYEDGIVQAMVRADGGKGNIHILYPNKLGIWNVLLEGGVDTTWIFDNWEGVAADGAGIPLQKFYLAKTGIPYGYSPVIIAKNSWAQDHRSQLTAFLHATRKGYLQAAAYPEVAAELLAKHVTDTDCREIDLLTALKRTIPFVGNEQEAGTMSDTRVSAFLQWLVGQQLESEIILRQHLHDNSFLE